VLVGEGCDIDASARLDGPLVIGDGCVVGAGARVKHSVLLPGSDVPQGAIVAGAIYGRAGALA
jgi:mannose-1-phosphate guanylyltransferase